MPQLATHPSVVAAVAGLIAAAPVAAPSGPPTDDITLTSGSAGLAQQLDWNSALIEGLLDTNRRLVDVQDRLTPDLVNLLGGEVDPAGAAHGLAKDAVQQFFNANNALVGAGQAALLGLLGARGTMDGGTFTPLNLEELNASLLVDPQHAGSIPFAGLESAIGHYIGAAVFLNGFLNDIPEDVIEGDATHDAFTGLVNDVITFNNAVLAAEHSFNTSLVAHEIALEQALFGTDSAYDGVINRAFNTVNMLFDAQQQSFNGLLGLTGYDPQAHTDTLLIDGDGSVGGLLGLF